ncbi:TatD family hydrolase [Ammoniphilus resinae]|uniref:TatD DNase family protein n=1 Tax=Ammoniphilus resinae TaxID=861532 RepID=A0ABS4GTU9_9BACL|nr:TatD family hydrolase [Ammoniphilus resinae]MBP1933690.1 TatD DNase family protein [Ammoniphilus resinae]
MGWIDCHIHLEQYPKDVLDQSIDTWRKEGIDGVVAVATDLASSYRTLELARLYSNFVYPAVGYHPEQELPSSREMEELLSLIKLERESIVAIGEVGLPYYSKIEDLLPYEETLETFVQAAKNHNLPVLLHAVHNQAEIALQILTRQEMTKAHFHWLKAPKSVLLKIIQAGFFISLTPEVCYRLRDQKLAVRVPLSQLLLETDGPWPYPKLSIHMQTTPLMIRDSAKKIARLKGVSEETLQQACANNFDALFNS